MLGNFFWQSSGSLLGFEFSPWLGNEDYASQAVKPNKKKIRCSISLVTGEIQIEKTQWDITMYIIGTWGFKDCPSRI